MARSKNEAQEQVNEALRHKERAAAAVANVKAAHWKQFGEVIEAAKAADAAYAAAVQELASFDAAEQE